MALLLFRTYYNEIPVVPIFLAELTEDKPSPFHFNHQFPDVSHKRNKSAQKFIDDLR